MSGFNQEAYDRAVARKDLARTDLEELAQQVDDGEIDEETAAGLRGGYEAELAAAEADLAKIGTPPKSKKTKPAPAASASTKRAPSEKGQAEAKSGGLNKRILAGAGIFVAALVIILISVQNSSEPDPPAATGAMPPGATGADPCEELAAALTDHPDNGFRLALADCYSQTGNAMSAIEHYRAVADSTDAVPAEAAEANVGLGYLNLQIGELQNAAGYMETALQAEPENIEAQYFLGMMLIYDLDDPERGTSYLESVLEAPDLPPTVIQDIETALALAQGDGTGS
jgi:tetratricopeptide (TPR) repeat protein